MRLSVRAWVGRVLGAIVACSMVVGMGVSVAAADQAADGMKR